MTTARSGALAPQVFIDFGSARAQHLNRLLVGSQSVPILVFQIKSSAQTNIVLRRLKCFPNWVIYV